MFLKVPSLGTKFILTRHSCHSNLIKTLLFFDKIISVWFCLSIYSSLYNGLNGLYNPIYCFLVVKSRYTYTKNWLYFCGFPNLGLLILKKINYKREDKQDHIHVLLCLHHCYVSNIFSLGNYLYYIIFE